MPGDLHPDRALAIEDAEQVWADGVKLAKAGDNAGALACFLRCAESAQLVGASYAIGNLYERGPDGVPRDLASAERWYRRAVADGDSNDARFDLARIILSQHRHGTSAFDRERSDEAVALLKGLAEKNDPYALIYLGLLALEGIAMPQSIHRAEELFARAAGQGFVFALVQLSRVAAAKGQYLRAVAFRIQAALRAFALFVRHPNDKRLSLMHQGVGIDSEYPGWTTSKHWPRF